ncbi:MULTISPECIES: shikimate dehydrogenase [unclassified Thermoactinomyces]|uniref:shikimate dehydrogenase n=1 Tax=unclassified Thermoactinomyces TaxID=2634588 RepID=UPI0018DAFF80|nr:MULTISPECIES: shikimate dehydrogenase [unclassified Thermoactinomyces]MBH8599052.1 shikimate dehydrogenase [Thermoactinomyces sp. CICC 10523]MBH8608017.1 shikimate dehydrogenase [Thermoactinomyces sp. CICC 10521]
MIYSALLGNPVDHSVSPLLFKEFADLCGIENYDHLKLCVLYERELPAYLRTLQLIGCVGANVTLPYKLSVIPYLNEVDERTKAIGAVNTIIFENDLLLGTNTDGVGAFRAITEQLRGVTSNDKIVVLGSGGAARAIIYELYKVTDQITILARDKEEAEKISIDFSCSERAPIMIQSLDEENLYPVLKDADFLVQATPVGMYPKITESLVSEDLFNRLSLERDVKTFHVFDAVFNPYKTLLLQYAEKFGFPTCSGIWMMIYQAVDAFNLWTGFDVSHADFAVIESKLNQAINNQYKILE